MHSSTQGAHDNMAHVQGLELRCADAQRAVAALLAVPGAVLVGHALHHDLHALRIDFQPVIDTSFLFSYKCGPICARVFPHSQVFGLRHGLHTLLNFCAAQTGPGAVHVGASKPVQ